MDKVYCIGDSHISLFSGYNRIMPKYPSECPSKFSFFEIFHLGPVLAYSLHREKTSEKGREKLFSLIDQIPQKAKIIFCFGEIDCRNHLVKVALKSGKSIEEVTDTCVELYLGVLDEVRKLGYSPIVCSVAPAIQSPRINNRFPFHGNPTERRICSTRFNSSLKNISEKLGFPFIDISTSIQKGDSFVNAKYFLDDCHLSNSVFPYLSDQLADNKIIDKVQKRKMNAVATTSFLNLRKQFNFWFYELKLVKYIKSKFSNGPIWPYY